MMEEDWVVSRSKLREVWVEHPEWSRQKMANEVGRSKSWVKKWLKRIRGAPLKSQEVLRGKSLRSVPTPRSSQDVPQVRSLFCIT